MKGIKEGKAAYKGKKLLRGMYYDRIRKVLNLQLKKDVED